MRRFLNTVTIITLATSLVCGFALGRSRGSQGTTLRGAKTAAANVTIVQTFNWALSKSAITTSPVSIPKGSSALVEFQITAERFPPVITTDPTYASGVITIENTGTKPTVGLYIVDQLEYLEGSTWTPIPGSQIIVPVPSEIPGNESVDFPYLINGLILDPSLTYRNHAIVTIDNYQNYEGMPHSIDIFKDVTVTQDSRTVDASGTLTDTFSCPSGFSCSLPWTSNSIFGSVTVPYPVTVTNDSVFCGLIELPNVVVLLSSDTNTIFQANATITVDAGSCGCTGTIGYWKTHPDLIPPLLPQYLGTPGGSDTLVVTTIEIAIDVLNQNVYGDPSNGITKLYAQLLSAKLAIQNGADPTVIQSTIIAADLFLAAHSYTTWKFLSPTEQEEIISWVIMLSDYNFGTIGPGHC